MAILMFGDFNGFTAGQINRYYLNTVNGFLISNNSNNRFANTPHFYSNAGGSGSKYVKTRIFTPISSGVVGFSHFCIGAPTTASLHLLSLLDSSNVEHIRISFDSSGNFLITRAGTALTGGTSANTFLPNTWYWIELKFSIADSIGADSVQLWINGVLEATIAAGQDTRNAGSGFVESLALGQFAFGSTVLFGISEFYVSDSTTPLGDCRIRTLIPSAEGDTQNFSSTGASHYTEVDDNPADDDSTYVESATPNHIELFQMSGISSNPSVIHAVSPWLCTRKTDAGHKTFAPILRLSSTNYEQSGVNAFDNYSYNNPVILELNPDSPGGTGVWDITSLDNTQVGLRVVS